jgi:hypothetical protein
MAQILLSFYGEHVIGIDQHCSFKGGRHDFAEGCIGRRHYFSADKPWCGYSTDDIDE